MLAYLSKCILSPVVSHYLDALRGLAALAVVLTHWNHFGCVVPGPAGGEVRLPCYFLLKPLYVGGSSAVNLFFCLSGFIFYWLYSERIAQGVISAWDFAALRFSRLYPLHFATLLFVAAFQQIVRGQTGAYFIYAQNDLPAFVLQLFMASNWGIGSGLSFNGPIWSVSVEVLLYSLFFLLCILGLRRWWQLLLALLFGLLVLHGRGDAATRISEGVIYFFMGGLAFYFVVFLYKRELPQSVVHCLAAVTCFLWVVSLLVPLSDIPIPMKWFHGLWTHISLLPLLFPLTIITLALLEARGGGIGRHLSWLGDISYSTYLIHFPLQLVFLALTTACALPYTIYCSPFMLLAFFAILIPLGFCSYHFLELPAQAYLRSRLLSGRER